MRTGLAVVNSNLPLSPRQGGEWAAEAGLGLHGRAPRPRRARGRGMTRAGAQGPPKARGGSSTCGARDRECARPWGARANVGGVLLRWLNAPAHRLRGLRSAWDPRMPTSSWEPAQRAPERGWRTLTSTKWGECRPSATQGCSRCRREFRPNPGCTSALCPDPWETGLEFLLRREGGKSEVAWIPELLLRLPFETLAQMENSVILPG